MIGSDFSGQGYLTRDLEVAARDGTIVCLAALGGGVIENFNAVPILYKRLTVRPQKSAVF
jgi:hypothetical protein